MESKNYIDQMEEVRAVTLARLRGDKVFVDETNRIRTALDQLRDDFPGVFDRFFRSVGELTARLQRRELDKFLERTPRRAQKTLQDYLLYARRFRVWFRWVNGSFKIIATGPWQSKFRAEIVDGFLSEIAPEAPGVEVLENERYVDYDLRFPTNELEKLCMSGKAKFLQLDDKTGKSAIHQIEDIAYDPDSLTFVRHKSDRDYLFCLVGENVAVDALWRKAGKVINSLQLQLYGRTKTGRRRKFEKWEKAKQLRMREDGTPLKGRAYELLDNPNEKPANLASAQSFLSKARKKMKRKTKPRRSK